MITIDEAIEKYKDIANTDDICLRHCMRPCDECAQEARHVAEWLEELKAYREIGTVEECKSCEKECYHKAIDSFQKWLKQQKIVGIDNATNDILVPVNGIWEYAIDVFKEEMAEQLKVGVENEQSI